MHNSRSGRIAKRIIIGAWLASAITIAAIPTVWAANAVFNAAVSVAMPGLNTDTSRPVIASTVLDASGMGVISVQCEPCVMHVDGGDVDYVNAAAFAITDNPQWRHIDREAGIFAREYTTFALVGTPGAVVTVR